MLNALEDVLNDIWTCLARGADDRRSAFHTLVVGTEGPNGVPDQRVMVLRKAHRTTFTLRFHTDVRSQKVVSIERSASISILGYDPGAKVQLRLRAAARIVTSGQDADAAWAATSASGRRSYLTVLPPGTPSDAPTAGLPSGYAEHVPTLSQSEAGRANFAIMPVVLDRLEWLHLASTGHRRAAFTRAGEAWSGEWLIP